MTRLASVACVLAVAAAAACGESAIVVGDDTTASPSPPAPLVDPDAAPFDGGFEEDARPITVPPKDGGSDGASAPDVTCPTLSPPAPSFCDGASPVPKYDSNGCIVGYGCAPLDCTSAGGSCVALTPGSCPGNKFGDATKYSCGGGLGVGCCLP